MPNNFISPDKPATQPAAKTSTVGVVDVIQYLLGHKWLYAVSVVVCLLIGYWNITRTPKTYSRTCTIMIQDDKGRGSQDASSFKDLIMPRSRSVQNELGIIKSRRLMSEVVERLGLNVSYKSDNAKKSELYTSCPIELEYKGDPKKTYLNFTVQILPDNKIKVSEETSFNNMRFALGQEIPTSQGKVKFKYRPDADIEMTVGKIYNITVLPTGTAAAAFSADLNVAMVNKDASLVNLSIEDGNPQRAEDLLNTLIDVYNEFCISDNRQNVISTNRFIRDRLAILEIELDSIDSQIERYMVDNHMTSLESQGNEYLTRFSALDAQELTISNQLEMVQYLRDFLRNNRDKNEMLPSGINIDNVGIQHQINEYNELIAKKISILGSSTERNAMVQDINNTLRTHLQALDKSLSNLAESLNLQLNSLYQKQEENLNRITNLPTQQKELLSIKRQQKTKEELYLYLLNKREETDLQQTIADSSVKIVDYASGSASPIKPNKMQIMLLALMAGIILPSLWLYIRMLLDTKVHTIDDIKKAINVPILGELPYDKQKHLMPVADFNATTDDIFGEALRRIRVNLNFMLRGTREGGKVIQVLSTGPDAGKTFVSICLAASYALTNKRVVILDLDFRKNSLMSRFNIYNPTVGLSEYLSDPTMTPEEITYSIPTEWGNFDIIPTINIPPNPTELLQEERLDQLIEELRSQYDYIICDNPPYGMVVDALVSSRFSDASVYVVRAGVFDKRNLGELQEYYNNKRLPHMSILLNGVDMKKLRKTQNIRRDNKRKFSLSAWFKKQFRKKVNVILS